MVCCERQSAWFAIEMRERYSDVAHDRWPVSAPTSSRTICCRVGFTASSSSRDRAEVVRRRPWDWRRDVVSAPRPSASAPRRRVAALLGNRTGVPREAVSATVMSGCALTPLLLPLRVTARRNRSALMQHCFLCLADDASPYFRRQRRLGRAFPVSCMVVACVIVVPPAAVSSPPLIRTNLSLSISAPNAGSTCAWRRKLSSTLSAAARKMHRRYLQVGADHRFEDSRRFGFTPVARTGPGRQHFGEKPTNHVGAGVRCFEQLARRVSKHSAPPAANGEVFWRPRCGHGDPGPPASPLHGDPDEGNANGHC